MIPAGTTSLLDPAAPGSVGRVTVRPEAAEGDGDADGFEVLFQASLAEAGASASETGHSASIASGPTAGAGGPEPDAIGLLPGDDDPLATPASHAPLPPAGAFGHVVASATEVPASVTLAFTSTLPAARTATASFGPGSGAGGASTVVDADAVAALDPRTAGAAKVVAESGLATEATPPATEFELLVPDADAAERPEEIWSEFRTQRGPTERAGFAGQFLRTESARADVTFYDRARLNADPESLARQVSLQLGGGPRQVTMQLQPLELGRLEIVIESRDDSVSVNFVAHTAHARDLIESGMGRLRELLQQQGLELDDAEVQQAGEQSSQSGTDGGADERDPQGERTAVRRDPVGGASAAGNSSEIPVSITVTLLDDYA